MVVAVKFFKIKKSVSLDSEPTNHKFFPTTSGGWIKFNHRSSNSIVKNLNFKSKQLVIVFKVEFNNKSNKEYLQRRFEIQTNLFNSHLHTIPSAMVSCSSAQLQLVGVLIYASANWLVQLIYGDLIVCSSHCCYYCLCINTILSVSTAV